jgi:hypothetical protein
MPNGNANLLAAPLQSLSQMGTQMTQSLQNLGNGFTSSLSQGLNSLAQGLPALPALPGAGGQAVPMALPQFPTPQSLMPANLSQTLSQIENVVIPQGLPKPSSLIPVGGGGQSAGPTTPSVPSTGPMTTTLPAIPVGVISQGSPSSPEIMQKVNGGKPAVSAIQRRRRITDLGGY